MKEFVIVHHQLTFSRKLAAANAVAPTAHDPRMEAVSQPSLTVAEIRQIVLEVIG